MSEPAAPPPVTGTIAYGCQIDTVLPAQVLELLFFREAKKLIAKEQLTGYTGEGRMWHARKFIDATWRSAFAMHDWAESQLEMFCEYQWSTVTGPAAGGKTTAAAIYALMFWMCDPINTAVIVTSTTVPGLRKRIWKEIKHYWQLCQAITPTANLVESKMSLQAEKNNDGCGIFGIAVAAGQTEKALGRIIGFHPKRLLIIVDEMTDTPEAIVEACVNLSKTEGEFQFIGLGNAKSIFDPHGKMSEPKTGWKSVGVEDDFWETKLGACLHLDGMKSPNLKTTKPKFPYLIKQSDIDTDKKNYGDNSPKFWRFCRGFWAPQGLSQTVLTEQMFIQYDAKAGVTWVRGVTKIAGLDVSLGGDRCVLRFANYGKEASGKTIIEMGQTVFVPIDADGSLPVHFQIARFVKEECKKRGVLPQNFGLDAGGLGSGTADILQREWSPSILRVEFGGYASPGRQVSDTNDTKCSDEYFNFVTELWFQFRQFVEGRQIRALDDAAAFEFCCRQWDDQSAGGRIRVEPKDKMKERMHVSPDLADACVIVCEVARRQGVTPAGFSESMQSPEVAAQSRVQLRAARELDFDSYESNYLTGEL